MAKENNKITRKKTTRYTFFILKIQANSFTLIVHLPYLINRLINYSNFNSLGENKNLWLFIHNFVKKVNRSHSSLSHKLPSLNFLIQFWLVIFSVFANQIIPTIFIIWIILRLCLKVSYVVEWLYFYIRTNTPHLCSLSYMYTVYTHIK